MVNHEAAIVGDVLFFSVSHWWNGKGGKWTQVKRWSGQKEERGKDVWAFDCARMRTSRRRKWRTCQQGLTLLATATCTTTHNTKRREDQASSKFNANYCLDHFCWVDGTVMMRWAVVCCCCCCCRWHWHFCFRLGRLKLWSRMWIQAQRKLIVVLATYQIHEGSKMKSYGDDIQWLLVMKRSMMMMMTMAGSNDRARQRSPKIKKDPFFPLLQPLQHN